MKIWVVYTYEPIPGNRGGTERYRFGELCYALAEQGHEVVWWQSDFDHSFKKHRACETAIRCGGNIRVRVLRSLGYPTNSSFRRILHNRQLGQELLREMACEPRPDLVIAGLPSVEEAEAASLYCKRFEVPFVLDAHDTWPDIYLQMFPRYTRRLGRVLLRGEFARAERVLRSAAAITAVSDTYLEWGLTYAARPRGKWDRVFPLGSYTRARFERVEFEARWKELRDEFRLPEGRLLATFVGTLGRSYDIETIIRAAELLARRGRDDVHFVVVGSGDKERMLKQMASRLGNLTFTGRLAQDRVGILLSKSFLGLSSYSNDATQSLPYKPFEYMSAGLPQLCSLDGEARRLLGITRTGVYYKPGAAEQLSNLVVRLAQRPRLCNYMGKRAFRVFQSRFNMDAIYPCFASHLLAIAKHFRGGELSRGLRILYIHQHFATLDNAAGTRSLEFAKALALKGHHVTVLTGAYNGLNPGERIRLNEPTSSGSITEVSIQVSGIDYRNSMSGVRRAASFGAFAAVGCRAALRNRWDVIIATSTPISVAVPGILSKLLYRRRCFVFEVRDLWPDMLAAFGIRSIFAIWPLRILERAAYRCSDACIGLAPGIVSAIAERTAGRKRVEFIPNGCDLELFDVRNALRAQIPGVGPGDFVAMYAGAHGRANGLDALVDLAAEARRIGELRLKIVLVGEGKERERLEKRVGSLGLTNCVFLGPVPKRHLIQLLARSDCCLMTFENLPEIHYGTSPNKFFDYISMSKPVIVNYPGWMADLVLKFDCGASVTPSDSASFLRAIQILIGDPDRCRLQGSNARRLAESEFAREKLAEQFTSLVAGVSRNVVEF
jgi:glycosyltransferase involved in cell wall biosynthesis